MRDGGRAARRRPGGRIAFLAWQRFEGNGWLTAIFDAVAAGRYLPAPQAGSPGPSVSPIPTRSPRSLRGAGFVDEHLLSFTEPVWVGADAEDAIDHHGARLGDLTVSADTGGYAQLEAWA